MKRSPSSSLGRAVVMVAIALALSQSAAADDFLTGPAAGTPTELAVGYLDANKEALGLVGPDVNDLVVKDAYRTDHNGVSHVYLQQRLGGVEVVNAIFNVNVMSDGRILSVGNRFTDNLANRINAVSPRLQPEEAITRGAEHLGLKLAAEDLFTLETVGGPAMEVRFSSAGISHDDIPARLMYLPGQAAGSVRLVWSLVINELGGSNWWNLFVDAETGDVLDKHNWTVNETAAVALGMTSGRGQAPIRKVQAPARQPQPLAPDGYLVFALPNESPDDGAATIEVNPADPIASPFGWHDTDGAPGAESTLTVGNNVQAQTDVNANNSPGAPDIQPDGGPTLDFLFVADLAMQPETYQPAAVTNLFYWNNIVHDLTYQYGFDTPAGNFQDNTYGGGGAGGDPVQADAQDGSGTNNANFGTPPDGADPRMQMFIWTGPINARVTVNSPGGIAGDYEAGHGGWGGPMLPATTRDLEIVDDGTGAPTQGCSALIGFTPGNIALIDRGGCEFGTKALNAENAGADGAIIVNDQQLPNGIIAMGAGADGGSVTIPSVMIGSGDGTLIRDEEPSPGVNLTIQDPPGGDPINRDSDLDNGVIAHEYGHGISNRLTGGPANVGCLNHPEQAGEGWSDWWTLSLFPLSSDTRTTTRGVGNYVSFLPITGAGIRNFPYSTDLGVNPQTYADIGTTNVPHGVGEIWAAMLWEVYWNLVDRYGFDDDLYTGTGGNNLAIQLVLDGMKLQPCSPTFVDGRDGILAADVAMGGANQCEIWNGFAKRGVGFSATAGGTGVGDETEAFDLPPGIPAVCNTIFEDGFESGDTSAWSNTVP